MIKLFLSVLFLSISANVFSQQPLTDFFFGDIVNVHPIDDDELIVVSNDIDYHVFKVSINNGQILNKYIPEGRGPGESLRIESSVLIDNKLYLKEKSNQITVVDFHQNKLVKEQIIRVPISANHLSFYKTDLLFGTSFMINPRFLQTHKSVLPLGYILDRETFQVTDTLFFDMKQSGLTEISQIHKIEHFSIQSFFFKISESEYLFAFKGLDKIFKLKKNKSGFTISKTFKIEVENSFGLKIIRHPEFGYGIKAPATLNNFFYYKDDLTNQLRLSFSYGSKLQDIPYGYATYDMANDKFEYQSLVVDSSKISSTLSITKINDINFAFESSFLGPGDGTVYIID